MNEGKTLEQILEDALRRLVRANAGLGKVEDGQTLYERQPSKSDASLAAWLELNDSIGQAKVALQAAQIKRDPDVECEAGKSLVGDVAGLSNHSQ